MSATPVDAYVSTAGPARRVAGRRRWPLLLIGASAGTATWSGWVGLGELTGFGVVHPLPGIWDSLTVNTAITLPIGVEAYAVYALAVATDSRPLTPLARRWAWASAAGALLLGMGGQIAYHLLEAHQVHTAPWWVVALVSSLPVLVLGAASLLWHLAAAPVPDTAATSANADTPPQSTPEVYAASTPTVITATVTSSVGQQASTPAPVSAADGVESRGPRALPRPTAAARTPCQPHTTALVSGPTDAEILAALAATYEAPPSIRALMRTYGIGQARATRIHRSVNEQGHMNPGPADSSETSTTQVPDEAQNDSSRTTTTQAESRDEQAESQDPSNNEINSPRAESAGNQNRNHTHASLTE